MGWKYVMIERGLFQFPIIFPDKLVHVEVFQLVRHVVPGDPEKAAIAISAGVIETVFVDGVGQESESLRIKSRGEVDERIINMYNYEHGIKGL